MKAKRPFGGNYKQYDPEREGYGSPDQWRRAFRARMTDDEAREEVRGRGPRAVLGVSSSATWGEIKSAYRKLAVRYHPDKNPGDIEAENMFKVISVAYKQLEDEYKK